MANRFILSHLRNIPLLARIPPRQLEEIGNITEVLQLQQDMVVFRQGQPMQGLYLMVSGHAVLVTNTAGEERVVGEVHENQYIGEAALFQNGTERMSMRVTKPSILLFISRLKFHQVLLEFPEIRPLLDSQYARFNVETPRDFEGQRPGEQLLLYQKRHPWAFMRTSILPVLIGLVLVFIAFQLTETGLTVPVLMLSVVLPGAWIYYAYIEWQNDYLIITDQRVIHHQRTILAFTRSIQEVLMRSVQEANYVLPPGDVFARLFGYGTVFIRTAGETGNIELRLMPNPKHIQQILINILKNYREGSEQQDRATIGAAIDQILLPGSQIETGAPETQQQKPTRQQAEDPGFLGTRYVDGNGNIIHRKHQTVWLAHVTPPSLAFLGGLALFLVGMLPSNPFSGIEFLIGIFIALFAVGWFYWADWDWRNDMLILGDSTIRFIHRRPLWLEDISEQVLLERVDDVVVQRNGIINTLLNRGDISVSLIGDDRPKRFTSVGSPEQIKNEIFERRAAMQLHRQEADLMRQRQEIARYLDVYHERVQSMYPGFPNTPPSQAPPGYPPASAPPQQPPQPPGERQGPRPPRIPRTRGDQSSS